MILRFICTFCPLTFNDTSSLKNHITRQHSELCEVPVHHNLGIINGAQYLKQAQLHEGAKRVKLTKLREKPLPKEFPIFECYFCDQNFISSKRRQIHENIHCLGLRCLICEQRFSHRDALDEHKKMCFPPPSLSVLVARKS